jgi:endonuclease/exonuclease/phosphatase family metal-dependent hydrolase
MSIKTVTVPQGQCLIKKHNYANKNYSQYYSYIENNTTENYNKSIKFVDRYGPYLSHSTPSNPLCLLNLPYSSIDADFEKYNLVFHDMYADNAIVLYTKCINLYAPIDEKTTTIDKVTQLIKAFKCNDQSNADKINKYEDDFIIITINKPNYNFYIIFKALNEFFGIGDLLIINTDINNDDLKNADVLQNNDYIIGNWLTTIGEELKIDGWIRYVHNTNAKSAQEILIFTYSESKLTNNDRCNCNLLRTTCDTNIYNPELNYKPPISKNISDIRCLSYNVHTWVSYRHSTDTADYGILKNILDIDPDIFSLQEDTNLFFESYPKKSVTYDENFSEMIKYKKDYVLYSGLPYSGPTRPLYNTIGIKKSLLEKYNVENNNIELDNNRTATILKFTHKTNIYDVFIYVNTHFDPAHEYGKKNAEKLMLLLATGYKDMPIIITGDFNAYLSDDYTPDEKKYICDNKKEHSRYEKNSNCDDIFYIDQYIGDTKSYKDMFLSLKKKPNDAPVNTTIYGGRIDYIIGNNIFYDKYNVSNSQYLKEWSSVHIPIFVDINKKILDDEKAPTINHNLLGSSKILYINNKLSYILLP